MSTLSVTTLRGLSTSPTPTLVEVASGHTLHAPGHVVQVKNFQTGTFAEGNTAIPFDNTIPQITEGTEFMTLAITPTLATNKLFIQVILHGSGHTTGDMIAALFVGSTTDALATAVDYDVARGTMSINYYMTAGTTSELTFRVRAGRSSTEDFYFNGYHDSNPLFGGTYMSSITIMEIAQ